MSSDETPRSYYHYDPSTPAAIAVTALYGISLVASLWQTIRTKAWVWIVMVVAVAMEFLGFLARIKSTQDVTNRTTYILQFCLIILAPVLMAAAIYIIFGRIVFYVVPSHARTFSLIWVPPRFVTPIFVGFDVVALLLQTIGAVLVSATDITTPNGLDKLKKGRDLAMAGIAVQMAAFGLFTVVAARFQFTSKGFVHDVEKKLQIGSGEKTGSVAGCSRKIEPNWRRILFAVNLSCGLILLRSIYRMIEFDQGKTGEVNQHEYFMYILDVVPMLIVCFLFNVFPPAAYLPFMGFRLPKAERKLASSDSEAGTMELSSQPLSQTQHE